MKDFIDKMPINFEYLPWIIEGLPEAKIIMTERSLENRSLQSSQEDLIQQIIFVQVLVIFMIIKSL